MDEHDASARSCGVLLLAMDAQVPGESCKFSLNVTMDSVERYNFLMNSSSLRIDRQLRKGQVGLLSHRVACSCSEAVRVENEFAE